MTKSKTFQRNTGLEIKIWDLFKSIRAIRTIRNYEMKQINYPVIYVRGIEKL